MTKRILLVGGAGYIGSHVALAIKEAGWQPVIMDDFSTSDRLASTQEDEFIEGSFLDLALLQSTLKKDISAVIHLADLKSVPRSMSYPQEYAQANICGTIQLLNQILAHNIKYFIFSSSATVYGNPQYLPLDEQHPTEPINFYGFSKLKIEELLGWYSELNKIKYTSLRYFNVVGYDKAMRCLGVEKNSSNIFPLLMETIFNIRHKFLVYGDNYNTKDGSCLRDYIHVSDIANAHVLALSHLMKPASQSFICNLGSGYSISVFEILAELKKIAKTNFKVEIVKARMGDPAHLCASYQKANNLFGWKPKNSDLPNIIRTSLNVYQKYYQSK
ncbi:MAG: UDP-glucose 4-epimerase GalE [SAR324 cluster bacterium]|nr:UDP-glucose 4-epimerase GalE [SAR324 cluster bacterium]